MVRIGKEVAACKRWSTRQHLSALKRIIPRKQVKAALRQTRLRGNPCSRVGDDFMVWFVIAIGLFCRDCYRQIHRWLVPWKRNGVPGRSTLCMARQRIGAAPLIELARSVVKLLAGSETPGAFHRDLRLMAMDGFVLDIPDMPANDRVFGRPGNQRSAGAFPQAHVVGLVEAGTHVFWRWLIKPCHVDERVMARPLMKHLEKGMLLLWDRGFPCYDLVRTAVGREAHLLARGKSNRIFPIRRVLSDGSYLSRMYNDESDRRADRNGIDVRIIEYTLDDPTRTGCGEKHRLLTTLLDETLDPAVSLVELYHVRWEEELSIDELKTHEMERPVLRSQTPAGVVQEIYGLMLAHYVVRTLMHEAGRQIPISPLRLSFTGTLKILRCRLPECPKSEKARAKWYENLLQEIAEEQIPKRRNRINPRVIKRQQSQWPKKRPRHRGCQQPTRSFRESVVILR